MPKISVIIPVYNAEKYIDDCIDSVLKQTFKDFELILINDGSKDHSLDICKKWSNKDKRIKLFNQQNSGASAARNRGLDEAKGEWIVFVDSDDKVQSGYLSDLYEAAQGNFDIVLCIDGISVYRNGQWVENRMFPNVVCDVSDANVLFGKIQLHKHGFPFGKLYRRRIIERNKLRFDNNVCIAEDMMFMVRYMLTASNLNNSKVAFINRCNYCYNVHQGSLSTSTSSFENELYSYNEYRRTISLILTRFDIDNKKTAFVLYSPIAYYADRCLNAIFQQQVSADWKEQLKLIDRTEYQRYKRCNTRYESLLKFLFVHRFWYMLRLLR